MAAGRRDLTIVKGEDWFASFTLTASSAPYPVTRAVAQIRDRRSVSDVDVHLIKDLAPAIQGVSHNIVYMNLNVAATLALPEGDYYWDLYVTGSTASVKILSGVVHILPNTSTGQGEP